MRYIINGDGTGELRLRIYTPKETEGPLPCIYWIHGGGFALGRKSCIPLGLQRAGAE